MVLSKSLLQHYVLEIEPAAFKEVYASLMDDQQRWAKESGKPVDNWRLFAWLDRPAIWAMRAIRKTSGLDRFLLENGGLPGVTDVAELITFPLCASSLKSTSLKSDWTALSKHAGSYGVFFSTFLWVDWDAASSLGADIPRTTVIDAIRATLDSALPRAKQLGLVSECPPLMLAASSGDADLVLYGWVRNASDLDGCLLILAQMDMAALASTLRLSHSPGTRPIFRGTQTEMAIDLNLYLTALAATQAKAFSRVDHRLRACFDSPMYAEVGLARGLGSLGQLLNRLQLLAGSSDWLERALFGSEDLVLSSKANVSFEKFIELLTKLDAERITDPDFLRRSSSRLGVQAKGKQASVTPVQLFGYTMQAASPASAPTAQAVSPPDTEPALKLLAVLSKAHWREDLRILERMVERCVTLQKSHSVRTETKRMVSQALARILSHCENIVAYEKELTATLSPEDRRLLTQSIRLMRRELLEAGSALDQALSHHSKGVVSLLLHPASQARGPEHIGSEVTLSLGMGALFKSSIDKVLARVGSLCPTQNECIDRLKKLGKELSRVRQPTLYASHDTDFMIQVNLALLRVPRWALYFPSAASHLTHEVGHTLAHIGKLSYLLPAVAHCMTNAAPVSSDLVNHLRLCGVGSCSATHLQHLNLQTMSGVFTAGGNAPAMPPECYSMMEEIMCDVVSRLFSFPPSDRHDASWLDTVLDYITPFAGRKEPIEIAFRINCLRSAFVAIKLLRAMRSTQAPFSGAALHVCDQVSASAEAAFYQRFDVWVQKHQSAQDLPGGVASAIAETLRLTEASASLPVWDDQPVKTRTFLHSSFLLATALVIPPCPDMNHESGFRATNVWSQVVDAAWPESASHEETNVVPGILTAISDQTVPGTVTSHPEWLPALLPTMTHHGRVTPASRIALSYYFYNLYQF